MLRLRHALLVLMLMFAAGTALANEDDGLYAPPPPADAAYVRLIDLRPANSDAVSIKSVTLTAGKANTAGAYHIVPQGNYTVNGLTLKAEVAAGHSYTVVATPANAYLIKDPAADNPAKALLVLYNLTDAPALSLTTADGKTTVIQQVAPHQTGSRAVNPLDIALAIKTDTAELGKLENVDLERGFIYSVIASNAGLSISKNEVNAEE